VTELSRRRLLGLGLAAAGGAVLAGPLGLLDPALACATTTKAVPTLAQWQSLVGSTVTVTTAAGYRAQLRLQSAEALRHDPFLKGSGYSLHFHGARNPVLPSTLSVLTHPSIGQFSAVLFPICMPARHQSYQLIVDERRPSGASRR
jgi:hypothetical protein